MANGQRVASADTMRRKIFLRNFQPVTLEPKPGGVPDKHPTEFAYEDGGEYVDTRVEQLKEVCDMAQKEKWCAHDVTSRL